MLVSLTFDDGIRVQRANFFPILKEYGIRATFYVVTQWIGQSGRLDWHDLEELYDCGHEIGSHTLTHPHLTKLSRNDLDFELGRSLAALRRFGCTTLAYPFGEYNQEVINCAMKYYSAARGYSVSDFRFEPGSGHGSTYTLEGLPTEDPFPLRLPPCTLLDLSFEDFKEEVTALFCNSEGYGDNKWIILVFHGQAAIHQVLLYTVCRQIQLKYVLAPRHARKLLMHRYYSRMDFMKFRWMCEYLSKTRNIEAVTVHDGSGRMRRHRQG
jgi:hypothetical protein